MRLRMSMAVAGALMLFATACSDDESGEPTPVASTTATTTTTLAAITRTATTTTAAVWGPGDPLTIMPIGDSITQGETGWATYRCFLDRMLTDAGVEFDFVGSQSEPYRGEPYGCPTVFDQDHEALWGKTIDIMSMLATASVQTLQPDVALIHLGTNDIGLYQAPNSVAAEMKAFITGLQEVSPELTILVAQIIPCSDPEGTHCSEALPAFNDAIASFASLSTEQSSVMVVDMETGFDPDDLRDPWHPTDAGDEFIAQRWMQALQDVGVTHG